jgi:hypothetical protein
MKPLILALFAGSSLAALAQSPKPPSSLFEDAAQPLVPNGQSNTSNTSSSSSDSSNSSSQHQSTILANGKALSVSRRKNPDGSETITVTTLRPGGKPRIEELTPEAFEKKYSPKTKPAKPSQPSSSLTPRSTPKPTPQPSPKSSNQSSNQTSNPSTQATE